MGHISVVDHTIFWVYVVGSLLLGVSFLFKQSNAMDYTTGGGRLPSWAIGMSILATFVSSISFIALPGSAYLGNWNSFVLSLTIPIAAFFAVRFFVPLYRSVGSVSAYHFLELRFGSWAKIYASTFYLLTQFARAGAVLYLLALPLNAVFGWDVLTVVLVTGLATVVYSTLGGIQAVIWTDTIQGIILIGGAILCPIIIILGMPEGAGQFWDIAIEHEKFSLGSMDWDFTTSTFWLIFVYGLFVNLQNFGVDQNFVQRYITARTEKDAKKATWLGSLLYIPVSFLFFFIGTALFAYYYAQPELLPAHLQDVSQADKVFPHFIAAELPTGLKGLLIAAIMAAGMSTISTSINSGATVMLNDHYKKYINPDPSEKTSLTFLRIASLAIGVIGIVVALWFSRFASALDAWWALASIFSGGMLGLFLLAAVNKGVRSTSALVGVVMGLCVIAWVSLSKILFASEALQSPFHDNMAIVLGTLAIFFTGFIVNFVLASTASKKRMPNE